MEEADSIILMSLRQLGCGIDEKITSVSEIKPPLFMNCCSVFLRMIDPSLEVPLFIPRTIIQRIDLARILSDAMKVWNLLCFFVVPHPFFERIGFYDEFEFHQFLYPSALEIRDILSYLMERIPSRDQMDITPSDHGLHLLSSTVIVQCFLPCL